MDKKRISIIVFIVGIITLIAGVIFLVVQLNSGPAVHDGEYLVSIGEWMREGGNCAQLKCVSEDTKCLDLENDGADDCESGGVIWNFTEIGEGTLTTNNHLNDYDFKWLIEDGKLKIRTDWLYELNDEFEYSLDQNNNVLILKKDGEEIKFIPASS